MAEQGRKLGSEESDSEHHGKCMGSSCSGRLSNVFSMAERGNILKMNFSVGVSMYSEKVTSYW